MYEFQKIYSNYFREIPAKTSLTNSIFSRLFDENVYALTPSSWHFGLHQMVREQTVGVVRYI